MSYISAARIGEQVHVWERHETGRELVTYPTPYYFYVKHSKGTYTSMYGDKLTRLDFKNSRDFNMAKREMQDKGIQMFESDIPGELKVLSEHYYGVPAPKLHVTFLDIEVDYSKELGFSTITNPYAEINAIAMCHQWLNKYVIFAIPPQDANCEVPNIGMAEQNFIDAMNDISPIDPECDIHIEFFATEKQLLQAVLDQIEDTDICCGWNSDFFDMPYIAKRLEVVGGTRMANKLCFPGAKKLTWREIEKFGQQQWMIDMSGRQRLDYLELFKKYEVAERPSYKLESIADEQLPDLPKLKYTGTLADLFRNDFNLFIRYNIRDTEILKGFEDKLGYVELANTMVHISTAEFKHVGGTLKLAELATINECHYEFGGIIVNDLDVPDVDGQIQGALVLLPQTGMQERTGAVDLASLYPSGIRAINISPETIIGQFTLKPNPVTMITGEGVDCLPVTSGAVHHISNKTQEELSLEFDDGQVETKTGAEWKDYLLENKWSVSGYGTVFNQNIQGIIPRILEGWYSQRKVYQKKSRDAYAKGNFEDAAYFDRLQYVYKIKLNSFYGALTNKYFRFYDLRMGESTTGTGRSILLHQCAQTAKELDGVYQLPDRWEIRTVKGIDYQHWGYSDKWSVVYGDSVSGDTVVETLDGPVRISTLFGSVDDTDGNKEYCNTVDCRALTYSKMEAQNVFRDIKYVVRHKVSKKMYRVWFGNTNYIDVTEDHALIGYANSNHKTPGLVEIKPTEIGTNNVNSLVLNSHIPHANPGIEHISLELCQLMGLIIGDGHVEKSINSGVGLSLGVDDKSEIITKVIEPLIDQGWFTSIVHMKNTHDIRLCGVKGWKFLRDALYVTGVKSFPNWVHQLNTEQMQGVLRGYFTADGFANKNNTVGLCSVNLEFITTVQRLLLLCGVPSNYWTETTENSFNGVYSGTHTIRLTVYDSVKFGIDIGFILDRKQRNIKTKYGRNTQHRLEQSGYTLIVPTKVEEIIGYDDYVYDIEVDDTHMFYANNILVHNTDSTYFHTHGDTPEAAIVVADAIGERVNASFPKFMRDTFLCQPGYDEIIQTGREIVSSKGIFVDKKRYILHIIDDEGKTVDKMKVMGLDTKKTTMPKVVANKLNAYIEQFLKGTDWDVIASEIVEYKDQLANSTNIMDIGLPKGIKGIEQYTDDLKIFGAGQRLPGHVAAAIFYNQCRELRNDKESMPIISGMKIKVFYMKNKIGRFKSIALPVDQEEIPAWFLDEFVELIDVDAHLERLVDNPLQNIIKAVGLISPTKQGLLTDSLLEF